MANLFNAKFQLSQSGLKKALLPAIAKELGDLFRSVFYDIRAEAEFIIKDEIMEHPTYKSLVEYSGESLQSEFGIEEPETKLDIIISTWLNGVRLNLDPPHISGNRVRGGFSIQAIDSSYQDVINLDVAHHIAERAQRRGIDPYDIRWLDWLLLEGTNPLVYYYYVDTDLKPTDNSRTLLSVMRHNMSEVWRVPDFYAGTAGDNWITQAMDEASKKIQSMIILEITLKAKSNVVLRRV